MHVFVIAFQLSECHMCWFIYLYLYTVYVLIYPCSLRNGAFIYLYIPPQSFHVRAVGASKDSVACQLESDLPQDSCSLWYFIQRPFGVWILCMNVSVSCISWWPPSCPMIHHSAGQFAQQMAVYLLCTFRCSSRTIQCLTIWLQYFFKIVSRSE